MHRSNIPLIRDRTYDWLSWQLAFRRERKRELTMTDTSSHLAINTGYPLRKVAFRKGGSAAAILPHAVPRVMANAYATSSIHPIAIAIPLASAAYLVVAFWVTFAGGEASLVLVMVTLIFAMLYGLMAACGAYARDMELNCPHSRSFREFLKGVVDVETGQLTGYDALWQIATLPVALAIAGTAVMICYAVTPG
jgi:hypothetical protein